MFFQKPRDLLEKYEKEPANKGPNAVREESILREMGSVFLKIVLFPLRPVLFLYKTIEYVHLLFFVIFGGLFLYFGITGVFVNSWTDTALLSIIGAILIIAPIVFVFDKD